jgi:hypothetical protein
MAVICDLKLNAGLQRLKINLEKLTVAHLVNEYPDIYETH